MHPIMLETYGRLLREERLAAAAAWRRGRTPRPHRPRRLRALRGRLARRVANTPAALRTPRPTAAVRTAEPPPCCS